MTQIINFDALRAAEGSAALIFIRAVIATGGIPITEDGNYSLEFSVQGSEVDFNAFCAAFESTWDAEVAAAAEARLNSFAPLRALGESIAEAEAAATRVIDGLRASLATRTAIDGPLSIDELLSRQRNGIIEVVVRCRIADFLGQTPEDVAETLSIRVTGEPGGLSSVMYTPVGAADGDVLLKVAADVSPFFNDDAV